MYVRRTPDLHSEVGVRINKTFQTLVHDVGEHDNLTFVEKDVRNYINKERHFRIRNIFWANATSRAAYEFFGDIVSFDTTDLTNKYDMPFAAFVGVNHHEKLKGYGQYKQIKSAMKDVVYDSLMKDDFEEKWYSFLKKFDVQQNEWLCGLFNDQHRWVLIYLKQDFWAELLATQRSESVHAFFDEYLNSKTSLQQFVKQYDNALRSKVEKEVKPDFRTMNTIIQCGSNSLIERQFQAEYTNAKFAAVQAEFRGKMNYATPIKFEVGTIISYNVCEDFIFCNQMKEAKFEVIFNRRSKDISCQCLLFEFRGIMCKHSLSVLGIKRVKQVPSKYILSRWSKNIKRRHSYIKVSYDKVELKPMNERYDNLSKHFYNVAEMVANSEEESLGETVAEQCESNLCIQSSVKVVVQDLGQTDLSIHMDTIKPHDSLQHSVEKQIQN
ncbi:protein FAR-RED ELONGATED HYPOCOTYL 3-like [Abrus precatorius]|uniref:Protein FAR1-RELATED SEQUENCE n=1 Tax=Abrus precatorius TaxID=3816 RepID=A0A8B8KGX2_ABRPR|nr:protein FAR-RED ELONGATED HYPOCOTYL 3-like [Abrus precatorius]